MVWVELTSVIITIIKGLLIIMWYSSIRKKIKSKVEDKRDADLINMEIILLMFLCFYVLYKGINII